MLADGSAPEPRGIRRVLHGWGLHPATSTEVFEPADVEEVRRIVVARRPLIARGLGRSYGDAALNAAGGTLLTDRLTRLLHVDQDTGLLRCEGGVSLETIITTLAPRGLLPPVTPGTKHVTVGGAIACDVHGKSHHVDGAFSRHVRSLRLLLADGAEVCCSRDADAELFWATMGGMGLTGIVLEAELALRRVETTWVRVAYERTASLDETIDRCDASDADFRYAVAWMDCLARGRGLGRAVLMRADPAAREELPPGTRDPLRWPRPRPRSWPWAAASPLLRASSMRLFNAAYYRRHARLAGAVVHAEPYLYPLDRLRGWNRLYGARGFLQYQFVVPHDGARVALRRVLDALHGGGESPFLAVLKRFGPAEEGRMLSFPRPGYTLAVDLPRRGADQARLLDRLDAIVVEHGGRVYLAKDARTNAATFRAMYPELDRWLAVKARVDPTSRFSSDLARRLELAR